jgi:hypothetical protein
VIVEHVDFSAVPVTDMARAQRFHGETLGLGQTVDTGACHTAFVATPDGNQVVLHRHHAPGD